MDKQKTSDHLLDAKGTRWERCLRITRSKSGVGFDVVPMNFLPTKGEATTFATCLEGAGTNGELWFEAFTRTADVQPKTLEAGAGFSQAAGAWLTLLWQDWTMSRRTIDPAVADVFQAIRVYSREKLEKIEGKIAFTEEEFREIADYWDAALAQGKFWEPLFPKEAKQIKVDHRPVMKVHGLRGDFGTGGNDAN